MGCFLSDGVGCACVCVRAWSLQLCASPFSLLVVVSSLPLTRGKSPHKSPAWFAIPPSSSEGCREYHCIALAGGWMSCWESSLLTPGRFRACLGSRSEFYHPGFGPRPEEFLTWLGPVPQGVPLRLHPIPQEGCTRLRRPVLPVA